MPNVKINDLTAAAVALGGMQLETDTTGTLSEKVTVTQLTTYVQTNTSLDDLAGTVGADLDMNNFKITNLGDPTLATDATNKQYVDGISAGLDPKESCRLATTTDLDTETGDTWTPAGSGVGKTITSDANTASIDTIAVVDGDRILVKNQSPATDNGIYVVSGVGGAAVVLTRATDFDGSPSNEVSGGNYTFIEQGNACAGCGFVVVHDGDVTVDTNGIVFSQFSDVGTASLIAGKGIDKSGSTILTDLNSTGGLEHVGLGDDDDEISLTKTGTVNNSVMVYTLGTTTWATSNTYVGQLVVEAKTANYTLAASDHGKWITMNGAFDFILPDASGITLPDGFQVVLENIGTSTVDIDATTNSETLNAVDTTIPRQFTAVHLHYDAGNDAWTATGALGNNELVDLFDVDITTGAGEDGKVVFWNNSTGKFELKTVAGGSGTLNIGGLDNVAAGADTLDDTGGTDDGKVLVWENGGTDAWVVSSAAAVLQGGATTVSDLSFTGSYTASINSQTLSAAKDIELTGAGSEAFHFLDPNGADRDVNMPLPLAANDGISFVIQHKGSADNLVVKEDGGATIVTLAAGEQVALIWDNTETTWQEV